MLGTRHGSQEKGQGWKQKPLEMYQGLNWQNIHLQSHQQGQSTADGEITDVLLLIWWAVADVRALQVIFLVMEKLALKKLTMWMHHVRQAPLFTFCPAAWSIEMDMQNIPMLSLKVLNPSCKVYI